MFKKRLVGVVTVKNGWAVQSFGFNRYLPLGKAECLVENLDRWGADEILIQVIDRSCDALGPDFKLLKRIGELGLGTPLIYSGGIRSVADGVELIQLGADRIVVDALLRDDLNVVEGLSKQLGAQAIIGSMPLSIINNEIAWYDYRSKKSMNIPSSVIQYIQTGIISEVVIIDWAHEGSPASFDQRLIESFPVKGAPLIAFGGISDIEQMKELFQKTGVTAVAVGNFLSYKELAIQEYKAALSSMPLRHASYKTTYSLIGDTDV